MDRAYANALKRKQDLMSELTEVDTFLKLYARFQEDGSSEAPDENAEQPSAAQVDIGQSATRSSRLARYKRASQDRAYGGRGTPPRLVANTAIEAILSAGEPLDREQLVEAVEGKGHRIASADKPAYLNINNFIN